VIRDMGITEQCGIVHQRMVDKGFWDHAKVGGPVSWRDGDPIPGTGEINNPSIFPEKLMLMVTEVAEVMEAFRDDPDPNAASDHEAEEVADILIRVMDYAAAREIDLGAEYVKKMRVNADRPMLHGRKR
jgi:NTP pyrophosphatase (non-canonical NTP hydrolase)